MKEPYHTSLLSGYAWLQELLWGHPEHIRTELGVHKDVFYALVRELQSMGHSDTRYVCQGFIGRTPARVQVGSLPKGLNKYLVQLPRLGQPWTHIGSKCLVMYDCKHLPWLITAPDYLGNPREEMFQVATQTFNVLYYFPFIWFNGSYCPRSYI